MTRLDTARQSSVGINVFITRIAKGPVNNNSNNHITMLSFQAYAVSTNPKCLRLPFGNHHLQDSPYQGW